MSRAKFTFTVEALPWSTPPATRLRLLLKYGLRGLGLKCIEAREGPANLPDKLTENDRRANDSSALDYASSASNENESRKQGKQRTRR